MKNFVNTVVGGAIGLVALYVVGRVAYQAGRDMAQAELRYEEVCKKTKRIETSLNGGEGVPRLEETEPIAVAKIEPAQNGKSMREPIAKLGMMLGIRRMIGKKESVIGRLVHNPEAHRLEAFVEGNELKLNVKPKMSVSE